MLTLVPGSFSGRDDPDDVALASFAMANNQQPRLVAETEHQESVFRFGVIAIKKLHGELVIKHRLRLFKRHPVFLLV